MRTLQIRAVIITDGESYFIHGVSGESASEMFKKMHPLWFMDPSKETVHYVEIPIQLPEFEDQVTDVTTDKPE